MYLVTGGAGFIGSAVVRTLLRSGASVLNVDALTYAANAEFVDPSGRDARHHFAQVDIRDGERLRALFERFHPRAVLHLAAESHVDRSIDAPSDFITTNVVGTFTLLEEARRYWSSLPTDEAGAFRFVHVSTDEVFGSIDGPGRFTEATPYAPHSPYAASKAASDHLARAWQHTYGLPVIVANGSNNYGPYQFPEKLISLAIVNAVLEQPISVYGAGENVRDWTFVDDHAAALLSIVERGRIGETYLIGAGQERRNIEVVESICDLVDQFLPNAARPRRRLVRFVEDRPGHDLRYATDAAKATRELGWAPVESFESGLRRTVAWYIDNRAWWERARATRYAGQRLGLGAHA
jgi:dTDP-glucose 4,6-dehydratase